MWNYVHREIVDWLLQPVSLDTFRDEYYERSVLHVPRNQPGYYGAYCNLAEAERVLSEERTAYNLAAYKDGERIPLEAYTRTVPRDFGRGTNKQYVNVVDPRRVARLFAGGCTLIYDHYGLVSGPISQLMRRLESFFGHHLDASLFLTPPNNGGFRSHWDTSDGLILQVEGRKRWRLCKPTTELPLDTQPHTNQPDGELLFEVDLQPGDLLYLPRGTYHQGRALTEHSMHIALGMYPVRTASLLERAVQMAAKRDSRLRRTADLARDWEELQPVLARALSRENLEMTLRSMQSAQFTEAPEQRCEDTAGLFSEILRAAELDDNSLIALRADAGFEMSQSAGSTAIRFGGNQLVLPACAAPMISVLRRMPAARIGDLRKYGTEAAHVARQLIGAGLAVQLSPNGSIEDAPTVSRRA